MTSSLAQFQSAFARALMLPRGDPCGPLSPLAAQPAFSVYRNTVMKACIDALEANYPSAARLVGSSWFRAAAARYVLEHPPRDARLLLYGEAFADFLHRFEPVRELPYLAGVAQLDRCWTEAHVAADAEADIDGLATLSPAALGGTRLAPHPAARWRWFSDQPIFTLWSRNRTNDAGDCGEITWQGEGVLITRPGDAVAWRPASRAHCAFMDACGAGAALDEAAAAAIDIDPGIELAELLASLLRSGALILATADATGELP